MFKKVLWNLALMGFGAVFVSIASATTLTIPNTFSPGTTIQSALMNANFSSIASWGNGNITDSNIGSAGIKPLHILCTNTPDCTFGSAQTYVFNPNSSSIPSLAITNAASSAADYLDVGPTGNYNLQVGGTNLASGVAINAVAANDVPLTINGVVGGGQTNDYLDMTASGGLVGGIFKIDANGNTTVGADLVLRASSQTPSGSAVSIYNDNAAQKGMLFNVATGATNGYQFTVNNSASDNVQFPSTGGIETTTAGQTQLTYLPPMYTTAGAKAANTVHGTTPATLTCTFAANQTCTTSTVTFVGAAAFTSNSSYLCTGMGNTSATANPAQIIFNPISGNQFNFTEDSVSNNSRTDTITYTCIGT